MPFTVGRGPVPRHATIGTRNCLGWRTVFAQIERSRGTGPRATVLRTFPGPVGETSRSRCNRLPRYGEKSVPFTVGRGPVPRHATIGTRNCLGWRAFFARVGHSRGTGPRTTGQGGVLHAPFGSRRARTTVTGHADDCTGQDGVRLSPARRAKGKI